MTEPFAAPPSAQPGPAAQPPYGSPVAPAPKKSSVGKILLIVLAVVLVLCVGGSAVAFFALRDTVGEVVAATNTRVVEPETLGGRSKIDDPELKSLAEEMVAELKADVPEASSVAGGFYGDLTNEDMVMIAAVSGVLADPVKDLDDASTGIGTELNISNFAPVEPGPLGGQAKCGDGVQEDVQMGVCIWTDRGSLGLIVMYFATAGEVQAEFLAMRAEIEKRD